MRTGVHVYVGWNEERFLASKSTNNAIGKQPADQVTCIRHEQDNTVKGLTFVLLVDLVKRGLIWFGM